MLFNNGSFVSSVSSSVEILYSDNALSSPSIYGIIPPSPKTWQKNMDFVDECQVIHGFSVVKCCFCYLHILNLNMSHIFLVICHKKFHVFHKSDSSWSRD